MMLASGAAAQSAPPSPAAQAAANGDVAHDQARRTAEGDAASRAARVEAPDVKLGGGALALGPFPAETPCFPIREAVVDNRLPRQLAWVRGRLERFKGRCVGHAGLNWILKSLEADFLARGLVTTRAGLPEQDLSKGTLRVTVIPGVVQGVRGGSPKARREWAGASPIHRGDLVNLRAIEQGLEQVRRAQGADVTVDLSPGDAPGESWLDLKVKQPLPISASVSVNDLAGATVGHWQASANVSAQDVLGFNEILSAWYNTRVHSPSIPADSDSTGASLSVPWGWWTFGVNVSDNQYRQEVLGQVEDFVTANSLKSVAVTVERVVHRDRTSKTSLQLQLQRRWGRSYIGGVEIGLQRQDLTDIQIALMDRRSFGDVKLTGQLAFRQGVGLLGAQSDQPGQPSSIGSARYGVFTLDEDLLAPLGGKWSYRADVRAQVGDKPLYGADQFSVGGPYTVRGYDSDLALLGRSGGYLRQELGYAVTRAAQPYLLGDIGGVSDGHRTLAGVGAGLRLNWRGFTVDGYAAYPTAKLPTGNRHVQLGLTAGWGF